MIYAENDSGGENGKWLRNRFEHGALKGRGGASTRLVVVARYGGCWWMWESEVAGRHFQPFYRLSCESLEFVIAVVVRLFKNFHLLADWVGFSRKWKGRQSPWNPFFGCHYTNRDWPDHCSFHSPHQPEWPFDWTMVLPSRLWCYKW